MFLKDLKEKPQRILFLELAALIMMAEGSRSTTSERIQELEPQSKRYALIPKLETESKKYACFQKLDADDRKYVFLQNIDENEIKALDIYAKELEIRNIDSLFSSRSRDKEFELMNVLEEKISLALKKYNHLDKFKEKLKLNNVSSDGGMLNIHTGVTENSVLTLSNVKNYVLKYTAKKLFSMRKESISYLKSKEKKIMLFELIGVCYSSGHFNDVEKDLLIYICELLSIENEYIEEFLDISERLFAINKELTILINE